MGFIRWGKTEYDKDGKIVSGSAAIIDVTYIPGDVEYHVLLGMRKRRNKRNCNKDEKHQAVV